MARGARKKNIRLRRNEIPPKKTHGITTTAFVLGDERYLSLKAAFVDPTRDCYAEIDCYAAANVINKLGADMFTVNGYSTMILDVKIDGMIDGKLLEDLHVTVASLDQRSRYEMILGRRWIEESGVRLENGNLIWPNGRSVNRPPIENDSQNKNQRPGNKLSASDQEWKLRDSPDTDEDFLLSEIGIDDLRRQMSESEDPDQRNVHTIATFCPRINKEDLACEDKLETLPQEEIATSSREFEDEDNLLLRQKESDGLPLEMVKEYDLSFRSKEAQGVEIVISLLGDRFDLTRNAFIDPSKDCYAEINRHTATKVANSLHTDIIEHDERSIVILDMMIDEKELKRIPMAVTPLDQRYEIVLGCRWIEEFDIRLEDGSLIWLDNCQDPKVMSQLSTEETLQQPREVEARPCQSIRTLDEVTRIRTDIPIGDMTLLDDAPPSKNLADIEAEGQMIDKMIRQLSQSEDILPAIVKLKADDQEQENISMPITNLGCNIVLEQPWPEGTHSRRDCDNTPSAKDATDTEEESHAAQLEGESFIQLDGSESRELQLVDHPTAEESPDQEHVVLTLPSETRAEKDPDDQNVNSENTVVVAEPTVDIETYGHDENQNNQLDSSVVVMPWLDTCAKDVENTRLDFSNEDVIKDDRQPNVRLPKTDFRPHRLSDDNFSVRVPEPLIIISKESWIAMSEGTVVRPAVRCPDYLDEDRSPYWEELDKPLDGLDEKDTRRSWIPIADDQGPRPLVRLSKMNDSRPLRLYDHNFSAGTPEALMATSKDLILDGNMVIRPIVRLPVDRLLDERKGSCRRDTRALLLSLSPSLNVDINKEWPYCCLTVDPAREDMPVVDFLREAFPTEIVWNEIHNDCENDSILNSKDGPGSKTTREEVLHDCDTFKALKGDPWQYQIPTARDGQYSLLPLQLLKVNDPRYPPVLNESSFIGVPDPSVTTTGESDWMIFSKDLDTETAPDQNKVSIAMLSCTNSVSVPAFKNFSEGNLEASELRFSTLDKELFVMRLGPLVITITQEVIRTAFDRDYTFHDIDVIDNHTDNITHYLLTTGSRKLCGNIQKGKLNDQTEIVNQFFCLQVIPRTVIALILSPDGLYSQFSWTMFLDSTCGPTTWIVDTGQRFQLTVLPIQNNAPFLLSHCWNTSVDPMNRPVSKPDQDFGFDCDGAAFPTPNPSDKVDKIAIARSSSESLSEGAGKEASNDCRNRTFGLQTLMRDVSSCKDQDNDEVFDNRMIQQDALRTTRNPIKVLSDNTPNGEKNELRSQEQKRSRTTGFDSPYVELTNVLDGKRNEFKKIILGSHEEIGPGCDYLQELLNHFILNCSWWHTATDYSMVINLIYRLTDWFDTGWCFASLCR
jgi:hypothetical protein